MEEHRDAEENGNDRLDKRNNSDIEVQLSFLILFRQVIVEFAKYLRVDDRCHKHDAVEDRGEEDNLVPVCQELVGRIGREGS